MNIGALGVKSSTELNIRDLYSLAVLGFFLSRPSSVIMSLRLLAPMKVFICFTV